jgi:hypothetical protein
MDPTEITKHIPEVVSVAKVAAASIPFTAIVKRMLGPAADEVAEMWRDQVRLYRYERQLKCVQKAERMAQEAGFEPQAVPPKILFPLLEGASFEDNEDLHTMWAGLLANASASDSSTSLMPGFIAVLKQMSANEAALLNWLGEHIDDWSRINGIDGAMLSKARQELGFRDNERIDRTQELNQHFAALCDGLEAQQLIRRTYLEHNSYRMGERQSFLTLT